MKGWINTLILVLALLTCAACLWAASHLAWGWALLAAFVFAHVANTLFALVHEAVHGVASTSTMWNNTLGRVAGWVFPLSFTLQRIAHLGHHQRNRTDSELYDYYLPHESRWWRNVWMYLGNLLGLYWLCVVLSNALLLVAPWLYRSRWFVRTLAPALGFGPYMHDIAQAAPLRLWLEVAAAALYQAVLFYVLDLHGPGVALCYAGFALHWSVLQYATHAWSARDVRNGAWNLRVLAPSRWLALNYHYHLAHHQNPHLPWYALPAAVQPGLQPSFWRVYFSLYKGVRPAPPMGAPADLAYLFASAPDQPAA